jgi:8-oxo-dGTP pyrophosphatase MutT (NUDIX family)
MAAIEPARRQTIIQSGVVPYRRRRGRLEVLLVTTGRGRAIVPKGHIESGYGPHTSAAKEAFEEAGVLGAVDDRSIGRFMITRGLRTRSILVYPMRVTLVLDSWPEMTRRERWWMSSDDAARAVEYRGLARILRALPDHLEQLNVTKARRSGSA